MTTFLCPTSPDAEAGPAQFSSVEVSGRWTHRAYRMSHDERTTILHVLDGIKVVSGSTEVEYEMDLRAHNPREFMFSPDNRHVAFWAPLDEAAQRKRVAVMPVAGLRPGRPPFTILYDPTVAAVPFGLEWSPSGDAVFVIERIREEGLPYTVIRRIDFPSGRSRPIVRMLGLIDFFMPPVSRFESGAGPNRAPYQIIFGARDGLYLVDPQGNDLRRISTLPAVGLHNIEWNPRPNVNQVVLFFRFPASAPDGRRFRGVYLVDLDRVGDDPDRNDEFIEQLYDRTDIHTLWYSPKGTYVTWASREAVWYRRPEAPAQEAVRLDRFEDDRYLEVRGVTWNKAETKVAFTAENLLLLHQLPEEKAPRRGEDPEPEEEEEAPKAEPEIRLLTSFPAGFLVEPRFVGDNVFLTVVEDIGVEMRERRAKPNLTTRPPLQFEDTAPSTPR